MGIRPQLFRRYPDFEAYSEWSDKKDTIQFRKMAIPMQTWIQFRLPEFAMFFSRVPTFGTGAEVTSPPDVLGDHGPGRAKPDIPHITPLQPLETEILMSMFVFKCRDDSRFLGVLFFIIIDLFASDTSS